MNREDIIQIATESWLTEYGRTLLLRGFDIEINIEELERFASLVASYIRETEFKPDWNNFENGRIIGAEEEREACAEVAEQARFGGRFSEVAAAIRARGTHEH